MNVTRLIGNALLPDLTEAAIRNYMGKRLNEGTAERTVNMEVGELSRAIGHHWSVLWPKVRKLEERKDAGRALLPEEEARLLSAAAANRSVSMNTITGVALLTGMRIGEITSLTWGQVDLFRRVLTVGRAKTASGTGKQIPMNADLFALFTAHAEWFTSRFGPALAEHYLFPFGTPFPDDPTRPVGCVKSAWTTIRKSAGVICRFHDLRHTAATKMAEAGVPESIMLALMGHMSRAMLERYSHIWMAAKRQAVEALAFALNDGAVEQVSTESTTVRMKALLQ